MNRVEREIIKRNFATIVMGRRNSLGLTQDELALKSKLNKSTIGRLENKQSLFDFTTIIKLAKGLKVSPGQLVDELAIKIEPELDALDNMEE